MKSLCFYYSISLFLVHTALGAESIVELSRQDTQNSSAIALPPVEVSAEFVTDRTQAPISMDSLNTVSGSGGDPLRALQSLPGLIISDDLNSKPAVRGTSANSNLYYIDALPSSYLFHVGDSVSILQNELIDSFTLYPAAFGAEFGDAVGAVFQIRQKDPSFEQWQRKIGFSLLGTELIFDGPIDDNKAVQFGFRRSFLDIALALLNFEENSSTDLTASSITDGRTTG